MSRIDTVLRLTPAQYRRFAEVVKAHGSTLRVFDEPTHLIGLAGGTEDCVINAASGALEGSMVEAARTLICTTIDTRRVRSRAHERFECDISQLTDSEMYPFWLHHEIGHSANNYSVVSAQFDAMTNPEIAAAIPRMRVANEILADRWAWAQVCDRPMPLSERGRRDQDKIASELEYLDGLLGKPKNYATRPWPHIHPGQYHGISLRMLARPDAHDWIGPDIHPDVKARAEAREARDRAYPHRMIPEALCRKDALREVA
jgi:hypothetical protein